MAKQKKHSHKIFFLVVTIIAVTFFITYIYGNTSILSNIGPEDITPNVPSAQKLAVTMKGEIVCLPLKVENEIQTDDCVFGLMSEDQKYYELRSIKEEDWIDGKIAIGMLVEIKGIFTPRAGSSLYDTIGSIIVDSYKVLQ